jgi:hypothetical protein
MQRTPPSRQGEVVYVSPKNAKVMKKFLVVSLITTAMAGVFAFYAQNAVAQTEEEVEPDFLYKPEDDGVFVRCKTQGGNCVGEVVIEAPAPKKPWWKKIF